MATRANLQPEVKPDKAAAAEHDAFVRAKVRRGLEESRDRAAMIPVEQAWRDLTR